MKKTRLFSCLLIMAMLVMSMSVTASFAASTSETIKMDSKGQPNDDEGDGWEYDGDTLILDDEDLTFKISGTCKVDIELKAGTLSSGTVSGDLTIGEDGIVTGGTYKGDVENEGAIKGGTFDGSKKTVTNAGGIISSGTVKVTVNNEDGTLSGGTYSTTVNNESVITGGTFTGALNNKEDGLINAKKGTFKGAVKNLGGIIKAGTFSGAVTNGDAKDDDYENATIEGGTFDGTVTNYAVIEGGEFNGKVTSYNTIEGGEFNELVTLKDRSLYSLAVNGGSFMGIDFDTKKFDEEDIDESCEFMIKSVCKGTGVISVPKTGEYDETIKVGVTTPQGVTLESISAVDGNGSKVKLTSKSGYYTFAMPSNGVTVTATFSDYDTSSLIKEVRVYIDEPEYDEKLGKASVSSTTTAYSIKSTEWLVDDEEVGSSYTLDVDEEPSVTIEIKANTGNEFTDSPTVYLNGVKASVESSSSSLITITKDYKAIKKSTHGHSYSGKYTDTEHWRVCDCGDIIEKEAHTYDKNGKCTVCGAVKAVATIPFTDVKSSNYYYNAVVWAYNAKPQVTDGLNATTFGPNNTCTRGQVVTFLWRAAGEPAPKTTNNPFTDVKATDYFYKPVLWAYEKGITDGTSKDKFSPNSTCTNAHVLTYVWRAIGSPNKDANATNWYDDAYYWAKYNGIINGSYTGTYNLQGSCPRANVVFYLYQYNQISAQK